LPSSATAEYVALYRALESSVATRQPLFRDPFAAAFLPPRLALAVRLARIPALRSALERYADRRAPGARTSAIARTCFIDRVVGRSVREGAGQLVLLGAGFDCRAHRIPELRKLPAFEVDRIETQAKKRSLLEGAARLGARADIHYVVHDFRDEGLEQSLAAAGFRPGIPTIFVWEGVTNYLDADSVDRVLRAVGRAAAGSRLVFTYVHRGALDGSVRFDGAVRIRGNVTRLGEPWTFGLDPSELRAYLAGYGLELAEDVGADAYRHGLGVDWGSGLRGYAFYRIAVAGVASERR
jgi:methyltransferase (TIGR00027 family)